MRYQGKIVSWNDERGFGFVVRHDDTTHVFLHISRLPRGAKRPAPGDVVTYALARDERGRSVAVDADYPASTRAAPRAAPRHRHAPRGTRRSPATAVALVLLAAGAATWIGYADMRTPFQGGTLASRLAADARPAPPTFVCEAGKTHCSHMRSLEEAVFYLQHCPNVQMDGNGDGEPCEQQFGGGY